MQWTRGSKPTKKLRKKLVYTLMITFLHYFVWWIDTRTVYCDLLFRFYVLDVIFVWTGGFLLGAAFFTAGPGSLSVSKLCASEDVVMFVGAQWISDVKPIRHWDIRYCTGASPQRLVHIRTVHNKGWQHAGFYQLWKPFTSTLYNETYTYCTCILVS